MAFILRSSEGLTDLGNSSELLDEGNRRRPPKPLLVHDLSVKFSFLLGVFDAIMGEQRDKSGKSSVQERPIASVDRCL